MENNAFLYDACHEGRMRVKKGNIYILTDTWKISCDRSRDTQHLIDTFAFAPLLQFYSPICKSVLFYFSLAKLHIENPRNPCLRARNLPVYLITIFGIENP